MRTVAIEVYDVNELSEEAKKRAHQEWQEKKDYPWSEENEKTLRAFVEWFPVTVNRWQYDEYMSRVSFDFEADDCIRKLTGQRLATYLWNNYKHALYSGRYYSLWSRTEIGDPYPRKLKSRNSKVMLTNCCPLTGYYIDMAILQPIYDFMAKPSEGYDFYVLMADCLGAWGRACSNDFRDASSMESFEEDCETYGWEFTEDGVLH